MLAELADRARLLAIALLLAGPLLAAVEGPSGFAEARAITVAAGHVAEALPVLSGAETFDVEAFRTRLRELRGETPYSPFMTAQDVHAYVTTAVSGSDQFTRFNVGWASLEMNWFVATLLGDAETAEALEAETAILVGQDAWYYSNVIQSGSVVFSTVFRTLEEAASLSMVLRSTAAGIGLGAYLPDAIDPEGFVRQRMSALFDRLTNAAEFLRDAGEAYSIY